ncbi:SURF4 family-domain-containing protein [Helicostylum pulchrum]|uniref:SURF4-domain-containing protein n=1 Tax=Helicostylum pulchrum TaxID=562976 RepID=A0ABP9Y9H6_9FUNG|nr:SURF4 family-domain-containing protein [Helicostylum pulchrum]
MGYSALKSTSERAEHFIGLVRAPIKPYLPAVSRFLIVATFYEDALRILWQWSDQVMYLELARFFPGYTAHAFLGFNAISMLVFATCIILKRQVGPSVAVLATVIIGQAIAYGLVFDLMFFLRNLSVTGGLLLCMSESILRKRTKHTVFASLPQLTENERHKYFQLAGRVLLVLLFIGFIFNGEWNLVRMIVSLVGLAACGMVVVGFRAKWSATFLVSLLCIINMLVNNWWSVSHSNYKRDFLRYDFFQCLSIMGGLLLLVSIGPGGLSYDEKKKEF